MQASGSSSFRYDRLQQVLLGYIERKELPGLVALVGNQDEIYFEAFGKMSFASPAPMKRNTIFRIASLTKPIIAAAAMILIDEGKLQLDESIEPWLPELTNRHVLKCLSSPLTDTLPAQRAITVRDLLTSRMGFGSVLERPDTYPIQKLIQEHLSEPSYPELTEEKWLQNLSLLPWLAQPGERWLYHTSFEVLGILISRVSGKSLGQFLRKRIFDALGMKDTAFYVPPQKAERLSPISFFNQTSKQLEISNEPTLSKWYTMPSFESGGGGLVSTVEDYYAFCQMMLNNGRYGRELVISQAAVELMTSDQLTPEQRIGSEGLLSEHCSWGFGMSVDTHHLKSSQTSRRFGWYGILGTSAYTDPNKKMIGIVFT